MHTDTHISHLIQLLVLTSLLAISPPIFGQDSTDAVEEDRTDAATEKTGEGEDHFAVLSEGPRSDLEIQKVVKRYHKTLVHYYERELKTNPGLEGTIKMRLQIKADGTVIKATVLENSVGSGKLARSVQKHCMKWQFKHLRASAHSHIVELELPFEPSGPT